MIDQNLIPNNKDRITFIPGIHKYLKGNVEYVSATTLKSHYVPKFDSEYWSLYTAIRVYLNIEKKDFGKYLRNRYDHKSYLKDYDHLVMIAESIDNDLLDKAKKVAQEWEDYKNHRGKLGSAYHEEKEHEAYDKGYDVIGTHVGETQAVYSYDLSKLPDGFYSELLLYVDNIFDSKGNLMLDARISGQADKVIITTVDGVRYVDIDDYKTCAKISVSNKWNKMLYPLDRLDHCDLNEFAVQLNIYAFILEQYGYVTRSLRFTHCEIDNKTGEELGTQPYHVPIFTSLIKDLIIHFRKNNKVIIHK